jgi:hypothetical protein
MNCTYVSECTVVPWFAAVIGGLLLLTVLILIIVVTWLYCRIFSKAGYCWALGLLTLVPIVNIVMLCILALGDWPVVSELRRLKQQAQPKPGETPRGETPA